MIKYFSFFADWRKKDVEFLNNLGLDRVVEEGYFGFGVEEGEVYNKIMDHYSSKDSLFNKTKPRDFSITVGTILFSKKELEKAKFLDLTFTGESKGDPQPKSSFERDTFNYKCEKCENGKIQKAPFRIKDIKWKKNQVNFTLRDPDFIFLKKNFTKRCCSLLE